MKAPPKRGPTTDEIPNMDEIPPMKSGLFSKGTVNPRIVILPEKIAEAPAPAIARPTINITEFLAAAHMMEPNSNSTSANRYVHLTSK